jgi:lipopolysaccharide/colanic/teichoic acid biosynthesis glycosyltransferase
MAIKAMRLRSPGARHSRRRGDGRHRLLDLAVVVPALVVLAPVIAAATALVRYRMGSPVLFRQERAGLDGRPFMVLKIRTMSEVEPGASGPSCDSERLTPLGSMLRRWSIDELPQLWNVLRGDMAVIGPRPLPVSYVERYSDTERMRLSVRPGITGLAQVSGRNSLNWTQKFELDLDYIDKRSLWLDLRIIFRTALSLVNGRGISATGFATMPEFVGDRRSA